MFKIFVVISINCRLQFNRQLDRNRAIARTAQALVKSGIVIEFFIAGPVMHFADNEIVVPGTYIIKELFTAYIRHDTSGCLTTCHAIIVQRY
ncbi:MAG: hypothetical protein IT558_00280 [Alphaproteobacteria bacterium]|nr:hypothetical protein [Alphaproteobacteria bacterium]